MHPIGHQFDVIYWMRDLSQRFYHRLGDGAPDGGLTKQGVLNADQQFGRATESACDCRLRRQVLHIQPEWRARPAGIPACVSHGANQWTEDQHGIEFVLPDTSSGKREEEGSLVHKTLDETVGIGWDENAESLHVEPIVILPAYAPSILTAYICPLWIIGIGTTHRYVESAFGKAIAQIGKQNPTTKIRPEHIHHDQDSGCAFPGWKCRLVRILVHDDR